MSPRPGTGFLHHALFYDSTDALLTAAVPFLRAGLDAGETAVLACRPDSNALLTDALGAHPRLTILGQTNVYTRTANAVATYRRMMLRHTAAGTGRVRLVGEVAFGADPDAWPEWIRYEAVVNAALAPYPLSSVCAYDTRALPTAVLTTVEHAHPMLLTPTAAQPNPRYIGPDPFLRRSTPAEPDPLQTTAPTHAFDDLTDPGQVANLRARLRASQSLSALRGLTRADLVAAVAELTSNGLIHGRPPVHVRIWITPTRILATVTDHGSGFDDPLAGYGPVDTADPYRAGAGLWLTRQSCDRLDWTTTPDGFTVRLSTAIPTRRPPAVEPQAAHARAEAAQRRADKAHARAEELERRLAQIEARLDSAAPRGHPNTRATHTLNDTDR